MSFFVVGQNEPNSMNRNAYLQRIGYEGDLTPTFENLKSLQRHHLLSVPFENLDIHFKKEIDLANTFNKAVIQRRGGFCYELNGLFHQLLKDLGFNAILISGRVYNKITKTYPPEFDHMAIIVRFAEDSYLIDVGNGEFAIEPLLITLNSVQNDPRGNYVIEKWDDHYLVVSKITEEQKIPAYLFTLIPRNVNDFLPMLHFQQTNPASYFIGKRICSLPTETGRITVAGNSIKFTNGSDVREETLESEEAFHQALLDYFNIKLKFE